MKNRSILVLLCCLALTACGGSGDGHGGGSGVSPSLSSADSGLPQEENSLPGADEDAPTEPDPVPTMGGDTSTETETTVETETDPGTVEEPEAGEEANPHAALVEMPQGKFVTEGCFLNGQASEAFGKEIFTRSALRFRGEGKGYNSFVLYEDEGCTREILRARLHLRYSAEAISDRALLIAFEQHNEAGEESSVSRYWILALVGEGKLLLDVDAARGASGPFLEEPSSDMVEKSLPGLEERAVVLKRGGHLPKPVTANEDKNEEAQANAEEKREEGLAKAEEKREEAQEKSEEKKEEGAERAGSSNERAKSGPHKG